MSGRLALALCAGLAAACLCGPAWGQAKKQQPRPDAGVARVKSTGKQKTPKKPAPPVTPVRKKATPGVKPRGVAKPRPRGRKLSQKDLEVIRNMELLENLKLLEAMDLLMDTRKKKK